MGTHVIAGRVSSWRALSSVPTTLLGHAPGLASHVVCGSPTPPPLPSILHRVAFAPFQDFGLSLSFSLPFTACAAPPPHAPFRTLDSVEEEQDEDGDEENGDTELDSADENGEQGTDDVLLPEGYVKARNFPPLSSREKRELRAFANGLGKKIVSQHVGKSGVTGALAKAISDALESKEILKLRILDSCPDEVDVVMQKIEAATLAQAVGKVGRVLILYRPSIRKLASTVRQQNTERTNMRTSTQNGTKF